MSTHILDIDELEQHTSSVVELENEELKLALIPAMGGKMLTLQRKETGTQFLHQAEIDLTDYRRPEKEEAFLPPFSSGFDECFPNVSASIYRFKGQDVKLPDHGELWTQAWNFDHKKDEILLWTRGQKLNYRFAKHIQLSGASVEITYELECLEEVPFDYIWSAHPLLDIAEGDELLLPDEINEMVLNWSSDPAAGSFGDTVQWPKILGNDSNIDFNYVRNRSADMAIKLFSDRLSQGKAGLYKKQTDESLMFSFDVNQVPFLGVWLCYGGWPQNSSLREYTLALEPCSGRPDSLDKACQWGDQRQISPSAIKCWQLQIDIADGKINL